MSEHHESNRACLNGIGSAERNADAPVRDVTGGEGSPSYGPGPAR
ncbi:hypothetical protein [Streptomyces sp. NPDC051310]